jgi:hypothetical protein
LEEQESKKKEKDSDTSQQQHLFDEMTQKLKEVESLKEQLQREKVIKDEIEILKVKKL